MNSKNLRYYRTYIDKLDGIYDEITVAQFDSFKECARKFLLIEPDVKAVFSIIPLADQDHAGQFGFHCECQLYDEHQARHSQTWTHHDCVIRTIYFDVKERNNV